jgi:hypothetical protein
MPEIVTKHPDVVKQVLQSAGAKCGAGEPQRILKKCPREQFCALPGGEICVYPPGDVASMTQLTRADLCEPRSEAPPSGGGRLLAAEAAGLALPAALAAAAVAAALRRRPRP